MAKIGRPKGPKKKRHNIVLSVGVSKRLRQEAKRRDTDISRLIESCICNDIPRMETGKIIITKDYAKDQQG